MFTICIVSFAQVQIVNDPTNLAKIGEVLVKAQETADGINKQLKYIEDTKKTIQKVSSYVRNAQSTLKALENAKNLSKTISDTKSEISKLNLSGNALKNYTRNVENIFSSAMQSIEELTSILTDDKLQMSDSERLEVVKQKQEELAYKEYQLRRQVELAKRSAGRKALLNTLSNGSR